MNTLLRKIASLIAVTFILVSASGRADTLYWTNTSAAIWSGGSNTWSITSTAPPTVAWADGDDAVIVPNNPIITIYAAAIVNNLSVTNGLTLQMAFAGANRNLTISGGGSGNITLATPPTGTVTADQSLNLFLSGTSAWNGTLQANFSNGSSNMQGGHTILNRIVLGTTTATSTSTSIFLNGGVLALNTTLVGKTATIGQLSGVAGSVITADYNSTVGTRGLSVNQSTNTTYAGTIIASPAPDTGVILALTKDGQGRLRLTGNNTYVGSTTISGSGSLLVNGTTSGQGAYTVNSGATLGGTGTIGLASSNVVTVASGGILSPGDINDAGVASAGTLTIGGATSGVGLKFSGAATINFALSTTSSDRDLIVLSGSTMSGQALGGSQSIAFNFVNNGGNLVGQTFDLISFGTTPGIATSAFTFSTDNLSDGWNGTFQYSGNTLEVTIQAVPEPSVLALGFVGLTFALLGFGYRRRFLKA